MEKASDFLATIGRLRWIQRWSLKRNTLTENVMEHSWEVAVIAHLLGVINQQLFSAQLNPERLATLAIYHDCAESITGDLPTPVKYYSKDIQQAYHVIERDAEQALLMMLPDELQACMADYVQQSRANWLERKYLKAADSLSAFLKAKAELDNGNREYAHTFEDIQQRLSAYDLPEVSYFLKHFSAVNNASELLCTNTREVDERGQKFFQSAAHPIKQPLCG